MAKTQEATERSGVVYSLQGTLLEACSCAVLCPCWIAEDPDEGTCSAFNAYHFDAGQIEGVDVSGCNVVNAVFIPGNVMQGNWRVVMFLDRTATPEQKDAIQRLFNGELGGPVADLAGLVGEVVAVEDAEITHEISGGRGTLRVGAFIHAEMEPYRGPDGTITTLRDSAFSTVPGSPAYVAKAARHEVNLPQYGMVWSYEDRNAIQSDWTMEFRG